jgi:cell division protein FtsB
MRRAILRYSGMTAIVCACVLFFAVRVPDSVGALKNKHEQIRVLQKENADLAKEIAEKKSRIRKLRESPSEQELEIRRQLKLQRQGETAIILDPAKK